MRGTLALLLSACLTLSQAWQLPADAADGIYIVETADDGSHNVTYQQPPVQSAKLARRSAALAPRQLPDDFSISCEEDPVTRSSFIEAKALMGYWCDNGGRTARRGRAIFKRDDSIAYMCAFGKLKDPEPAAVFECTSPQLEVAFGRIEQNCPLAQFGGLCPPFQIHDNLYPPQKGILTQDRM